MTRFGGAKKRAKLQRRLARAAKIRKELLFTEKSRTHKAEQAFVHAEKNRSATHSFFSHILNR